MFRRKVLPPFLGSDIKPLTKQKEESNLFFSAKDGGSVFLRNVSEYLQNVMAARTGLKYASQLHSYILVLLPSLAVGYAAHRRTDSATDTLAVNYIPPKGKGNCYRKINSFTIYEKETLLAFPFFLIRSFLPLLCGKETAIVAIHMQYGRGVRFRGLRKVA
jgi:hypothetical protein